MRRIRELSILALAFAAPFLSGPVAATTWGVPADVATIAAALDSAAAGDTVLVDCGTWSEHDLSIPSGVTLRGAGAAACVTIDGSGAGRVLDCVGVSGVRIESLTITGGLAAGGASAIDRTGGGLRCDDAEVAVSDCVFQLNGATYGAGVGVRASTLTIDRSSFFGNAAYAYPWAAGGGIYAQDATLSVTFTGFSGNSAASDSIPADGGGVFLDSCSGEIEDCIFAGNTALAGAGGIYSYSRDRTAIRRCSFTGNVAGAGGGMYFEGSISGLEDCTFTSNRAANGGALFIAKSSANIFTGCVFADNEADPYSGGAVDSWRSTPEFRECRFTGNSAVLAGGAISFHYLVVGTFSDCLFASNVAGGAGGAVALEWGGQASLTACTVAANSSAGATLDVRHTSRLTLDRSIVALQAAGAAVACEPSALASLTCSDVWGNPGGDFTGCIAGAAGVAGNFSADPLFCDAPGGDFSLRLPGSPALAANSPCGEAIGSEPAGCGCPGGTTVLVPGDFPTITAAIAGSSPGDVVGVCDGTWMESLDLVPGVHIVGVRSDLARVVSPAAGVPVLRAVALAESTVVKGLELDGRGLADWVVRADSGSVGLHLRANRIHGGATGGVLNGPDSRVTLGGTLKGANDLYGNGGLVPLHVRNLNTGADSLPATLNWWGTQAYDVILTMVEGPVRTCPITNEAHSDSLCAPLAAVGVLEPGVGAGLRLAAGPNPFREETWIRVLGAEGGALRVTVHDVAGRRVRVLSGGPAPDGPLLWTGRDESGRSVAPGVYFVRAEVAGRTLVRKLVRLH